VFATRQNNQPDESFVIRLLDIQNSADSAKWLARFLKASIILRTAQGGNLKWISAGGGCWACFDL
jgi:hypothetical protein